MSSVGGSVRMAQASNYILRGSLYDDLLVYTATSNQNIVFGTSNNSNMLFKISSNGFVGVGLSNPGFRLDVAGDLNFSGTLRQGGIPYVGSQWSNNSSNVFLLGSNVGIGVSNANAQLHVACNVRVDGTLQLGSYAQFGGVDLMYGTAAFSNAGGIILTSSNIQGYSNLLWGASGSNGTQFSIMSNTANDAFRWVSGAASNELMRLTGNGNLGIGVSNPIGDLQIGQQGTNSNHIVFEGGNSVDGTLPGMSAINFNGYYSGARVRINAGKNLWRMYVNQQSTTDSFGLETWNGTTATNVLFAQSNGNVGIGTNTPITLLNVSGGSTQLTLSTTGVGGSFVSIYGGDNTYGAAICASNGTAIRFGSLSNISSGMVEYMRINSNGNVGIGTSTPGVPLDIVGQVRYTGQLGTLSGTLTNVATGTTTYLFGNSFWNNPPDVSGMFTSYGAGWTGIVSVISQNSSQQHYSVYLLVVIIGLNGTNLVPRFLHNIGSSAGCAVISYNDGANANPVGFQNTTGVTLTSMRWTFTRLG